MNQKIKNALSLILVVAAVTGFFWFANFLGSGEKAQSEKPIVICLPTGDLPKGDNPPNVSPEQQTCNWTAHIHAMVRLFSGGKEIPVRFEKGVLEGQHTHSEPNKLHWHGLIPVDSKTKEVTDWSALEVQKIVTDFNLSQVGTPKFIVNSKEVDPSYIWHDGDTIEVLYE